MSKDNIYLCVFENTVHSQGLFLLHIYQRILSKIKTWLPSCCFVAISAFRLKFKRYSAGKSDNEKLLILRAKYEELKGYSDFDKISDRVKQVKRN